MPVIYNHTSLGSFKTSLAGRLQDPNNLFWSNAELGVYITEALRVWGLATGFWRDTGVLQTVASTPFYDLTTLKNTDGNTLLDFTVKDSDLLTIIQYHLLEPATGNSWTGSEQFTLADCTQALQRRRDQFISDTGCVINRTTGIATQQPQRNIFLSGLFISVRRVAFIDDQGVAHPLFPTDILSQRNYASDQLYTPDVPYTYSSASARPTEIILVPPTNVPGTLDVLSTQDGAALDPTVGTVLGIPDDYSWAIKWGALADLLGKDGPARDQIRSAYCERRYQLGVELTKVSPVVINAEINGVPLDTDSITNMDSANSTWQTTTGVPDSIASIRTLVAVSPCPNGVYSLLFDVVSKAPIPADDTKFIQIAKEILDPLLDYCEHLALFKCGGEEFRSTMKGAENFFKAAVAYNQRLTSINPNLLSLMKQSSADTEDRPGQVSGGLGGMQGDPASGGSATIDQANPPQTVPEDGQMGQ